MALFRADSPSSPKTPAEVETNTPFWRAKNKLWYVEELFLIFYFCALLDHRLSKNGPIFMILGGLRDQPFLSKVIESLRETHTSSPTKAAL